MKLIIIIERAFSREVTVCQHRLWIHHTIVIRATRVVQQAGTDGSIDPECAGRASAACQVEECVRDHEVRAPAHSPQPHTTAHR